MSSISNSFDDDVIGEKLFAVNPSFYVKRMKKKKEKYSQFFENTQDKLSKFPKNSKMSSESLKKSFLLPNLIKMINEVIISNPFQIFFTIIYLIILVISSYFHHQMPK